MKYLYKGKKYFSAAKVYAIAQQKSTNQKKEI